MTVTQAILADCLRIMKGQYHPETRMFAQVIARNLVESGEFVNSDDRKLIYGAQKL